MSISCHPLDTIKKLNFLGIKNRPWAYYSMTKKKWAILDSQVRCELRDGLRIEYYEKSSKMMKKIINKHGSDFDEKLIEYAEYNPDIFWTVFPVYWNMKKFKEEFNVSEDSTEKIKEIYHILRRIWVVSHYQYNLKSGHCVQCGRKLVVGDKGVRCSRCGEIQNISNKHRYNELKEQGICIVCKTEKNDGETIFCSTCREERNLKRILEGIKKRYFADNPNVTFPILKEIYEEELNKHEDDVNYMDSDMRDVYKKTILNAEKEIIVSVVSQQHKELKR